MTCAPEAVALAGVSLSTLLFVASLGVASLFRKSPIFLLQIQAGCGSRGGARTGNGHTDSQQEMVVEFAQLFNVCVHLLDRNNQYSISRPLSEFTSLQMVLHLCIILSECVQTLVLKLKSMAKHQDSPQHRFIYTSLCSINDLFLQEGYRLHQLDLASLFVNYIAKTYTYWICTILSLLDQKNPLRVFVCVCVCVCERERERERAKENPILCCR